MLELSIIIPALNEAERLPRLLDDLAQLTVPHQTIVVDGGSEDDTRGVAQRGGAVVLTTEGGRGRQLRAGTTLARASLLCFLHADARLPTPALRRLDELARARFRGARAFRLRIDGSAPVYRFIEAGANLRSRILSLPYGDQGLIIDAETYRAAGGFPAIPLMEDVVLARRLKGISPVRLLPESIVTSSRRWEREGPFRRTVRNQLILLRFLLGTPPEKLRAWYPDSAGSND